MHRTTLATEPGGFIGVCWQDHNREWERTAGANASGIPNHSNITVLTPLCDRSIQMAPARNTMKKGPYPGTTGSTRAPVPRGSSGGTIAGAKSLTKRRGLAADGNAQLAAPRVIEPLLFARVSARVRICRRSIFLQFELGIGR